MKYLNKEELEEALSLLGKRLEINSAKPVRIVVCGGSSLIVTGLVSRVTKDVDLLGIVEQSESGENRIKSGKPLPESLDTAAKQVAEDLGLDPEWLNPGPTDMTEFGLPEGLEDRLQARQFGNFLTVDFISRLDQIHLKVYASADQGPGRHVDDLHALKPTEEEMEKAARWAVSHDTSEGFKIILKEMLEALDFGKVAEKI